MKKYTAIAITALSLMALSCAKEMPVEIKNDSKVVFTAQIQQQADETKTTLGPDGDTRVVKWGKDDVIKVFNEANASGVSMGIKNKESYDPATTAEFAGEISGSNPFYAVYPSAIAGTLSEGKISVALPATQTYAAGTFANGANPSFAYSNDPEGGNLNFVNLCGVLKLKITSGTTTTATKIIVTSLRETEMLSGNFNITNLDTAPALEYVDGGSRALTLDLGTVVSLSSTATEFYFVVPEGSFASGMVVSVYNGDDIVGSKMTTTAHAITTGKIKNISSINIYEAVINLSASETANCYIVPAAGIYKFYAKAKGNDGNTATDITPASVAHLWSTQNSATAPTSAEAIVKNISAVGENGYVSFETTGAKGNVVVAGYDTDGTTILWSWHLWANEIPNTAVWTGDYVLMDRELGALSNHYSADNVLDLGLLYQYGRKDPFENIQHRQITMSPQTDLWGIEGRHSSNLTSGTAEFCVMNPRTFISGSGLIDSNLSWNYDVKTENDPCPIGYQVPSSEVFKNSIWSKLNTYGYTAAGLWFPIGHFIGGNGSNNYVYGKGSICLFSSNSGGYITQGTDNWTTGVTRHGMPIRCCKEAL